ncbi:MAG: sigma-70 family RNA polymerase sigma factor [Nitrospinota bacterium]
MGAGEDVHEPSDSRLVERSLSGELGAFEVLVRRYQGRLLGAVRGMLGLHAEGAEDLTQEVLAKAYFSLPGFRGESSFYTWLYRIAMNRCKDELRRMARHPTGSLEELLERSAEALRELPADEPAEGEPEERVQARRELVGAALESLPHGQREVLVLKEMEGMSYEEIAGILRCSVGTVKSRLARARSRLRERFAPYLERKEGF